MVHVYVKVHVFTLHFCTLLKEQN